MSNYPRPIIIGVTGGSASGKTSVAYKIIDSIGLHNCLLICTDSYYKNLTQEQMADVANYNFDHPDAVDFDEILATLEKLSRFEEVHIPVYDYALCVRKEKSEVAEPRNLVIVEGIFALHDKRIRAMMDLKLYVHTDDDERLARRILRDVEERGRGAAASIAMYRRFVKPAYKTFIKPRMHSADLIVPRGGDNQKAIDSVVRSLQQMLGTQNGI